MLNKKVALLLGFLCIAHSNVSQSAAWFSDQSALSSAHKQFLEGNATKGFSTAIEVLQNTTADNIKQNIDKLLSASISSNCGRDLSTIVIPHWLTSVSVRRMVIQTPGRVHHRLLIQFDSEKDIAVLSFVRWPEEELLINPTKAVTPTQNTDINQYSYLSESLNNRVKNGLYKLTIVSNEPNVQWDTWIVLNTPKTEMEVSWLGKEKWKTTQTGLLNRNCPLPEMALGIYDHQDNEYIKLWEDLYEERFPQSLPETNVLPGSYILSVSFNHKRFQGPISIQEIQAITKVINFGAEDSVESN
ncbi:DUF2861 family protein [Aliivibrio salmonicida]|uniref:Exported protein n=1 Tax=Aliivibrio salmonicida (strain LFI1238) TaxID=316275 RepID=B6ERR9_ALISL|nr:DUF2861 family protein [Aliivibrio salmonicida]AZL86756.1 DUF2861 family protein [Aliivibrio salmonicida]CAQ81403.1 putative exported protein [Aliivibrio salmonicida LFI1238]